MSRQTLREVLARADQEPWLIGRGRQNAIISSLMELANHSNMTAEAERALAAKRRGELALSYGFTSNIADKPYAFQDGVAVIPVQGTLINRYYSSWGYVTGYNFIRALRNEALDDSDVELIVYDYNTFGGEAAGCFELSDEMRESRDVKPQIAVIDSNCCSAGYALASAQSKIYCTPSGQAGSIGVVSMHVNVGAALAEAGIEITLIYAGGHKVDGNPFEALPADVRDDIQASVDQRYQEFVSLVVANRGLSEEDVKNTEAQVYRPPQALALNLIDAIQTPTNAVSAFLASQGDPESEPETDPAEEDASQMAATPEELNAARAEGAKAEKDRTKAIMALPEAQNRQKAARQLCLTTSMSADEAKEFLGGIDEDKAPEAASTGAAATGAAAGTGGTAAAGATTTGAAATGAAAGGTAQAGGERSQFAPAMDASRHPNVEDAAAPAGAGASTEAKPRRGQAALAALGYTGKAAATGGKK